MLLKPSEVPGSSSFNIKSFLLRMLDLSAGTFRGVILVSRKFNSLKLTDKVCLKPWADFFGGMMRNFLLAP